MLLQLSVHLQILHKDAPERRNAQLVALDIWYCTPLTRWWTSPGRKVSGAMRSNLCVKAQIAKCVWDQISGTVFTTSVRAQMATALYGSLCLRSDQWRWNIGTVFTAWQSVSLSDQRRHSGTSHPVVVSGICAGTYTYKKLNKVTSVLRLIPRPVHNQMPNVSNILAVPQIHGRDLTHCLRFLAQIVLYFLWLCIVFMLLCSLSCICFHLSPSKLPCHLFLVVPWHFPDTTWWV